MAEARDTTRPCRLAERSPRTRIQRDPRIATASDLRLGGRRKFTDAQHS